MTLPVSARSLFDCLHAIYPNGLDHEYVWCSKGHKLGSGNISQRQVEREDKLICRKCQICSEFEDMREEVKP